MPRKLTPEVQAEVRRRLLLHQSPERIAGAMGSSWTPDRVDSSDRPAAVEEKSRPGDCEVDAIVGAKRRGASVTAVDRKTKVVRIRHVERKTEDAVSADNGSEFAGRAEVTDAPAADFYFATPCHSRERGLNENADGRIRRFFRKGEGLREVDAAKAEYVEARLGHCRSRVPALAEARGLSPPGDPFPRGCG